MMGEHYLVELEFKRVGDMGLDMVDAKLRKAEKGFDSFKRGWDDLRSGLAPIGSAIDGVVHATMGFVKTAAMAGGAALFAGATYGVAKLNNELEGATVSLGTIFSAQGMAANVPAGMERAAGLIQRMRVDAQKLPGEFDELMTIFTTGAIPAFRSGAGIDRFRGLAAQAMAAGKVAQMDMGQVAREFAQLMEGRSGAHNVFGLKLLGLSGEKASAFNKMSGSDRLGMLEKELSKYSGAIDAFGNTFDAQSSTLIDNFKNFGRAATAPLFGSVKDTLAMANNWFTANQTKIGDYAQELGEKLASAFERGRDFIIEWWPTIETFAERAYLKVVKIWQEAKPYVDEFGAAIADALKDPNGTIDKMIELAKLLIELKIGKDVAGGLLSTAQAAGGIAQMANAARGFGLFGTGAAAAGGVAQAGGSAAAGGTGLAALVGPFLAAAAVPTAVAGGLWYGAFGGVATKEDHEAAAGKAGVDKADDMFEEMRDKGMAFNDMQEQVKNEAAFMRAKFQDLTAAAFQAEFALRALSMLKPMSQESVDAENTAAVNAAFLAGGSHAVREGGASANAKDAHKSKGGGGGIQKVEIVVTTNHDPSRIARGIVGFMGKMARNPGRSPDVRNFSDLENF